jgi:hypothetical protein
MKQADLIHSFRKTYPLSGTDTSSWLASSEVLSSMTSSKTTYMRYNREKRYKGLHKIKYFFVL